jgi:hypothetical protein
MASTLDLYIDTASGSLIDAGSVVGGALPTLTRNDTYTLRLRLLEKQPNGSFDDLDLSGSSLKAAIGNIEEAPSGGSFKLNINGITSSAISFNATAISVYNAISNNVSTVALYGSESFGSYLLTATQPNTAMSFGSDAFTLFPTSSVLVGTRRFPAASIEAQQVVKLVRNPIVYADTFTTAPTTGEIALTKLQDGSASQNETYELSVGPRVLGGSYALAFGANATTAIQLFTTAVSVQAAISAGINTITSNVSVADNGKLGYIISFTGRFALTNITTALTIDSTGVNFIPFQQTTLTINTAEVEDAFADSGEATITPTLEIELTQSGTPKTVYQGNVTIRKDLITAGSTVPGAQASYYTKAEANAAFVSSQNDVGFYGTTAISKPESTNVVSALVSLGLIANTVTVGVVGGSVTFPTVALTGSAITVTDNIPFVFGTTNGSKLGTATGQKISFYNSTPIVQPASTNVVSALVNLGLIATSVTLGTPTNVVTDWTGNVSATTRFLADSSAVTSVDWGNRVLKTSGGVTAVNWQTGSFGTGSTVVTIAANNVAISGSYYIAMGTGNGAFRTLSTLASVTFGAVASNDQHYRDVVVTGAAVNDIVLIGLPSAVSAGAVIQGVAYQTNTVCLSCSNSDNGTINLNTATYRVTVLNYA